MVTSLARTYAGERALVTGHTGFKGSWLAEWLLILGSEVTGYALSPATQPSLFAEIGLARRIRHLDGDVRDRAALAAALSASRPTIIFHLAAQALVRRGYVEPIETIATNVLGTANLLDAVRECPSVRAVVVVSSDKCYENHELGGAFAESDPLGGRDPYSASKACAEIVTAAYRASYFDGGPALASARAGNVIGGGDWADDRIVPDAVRALSVGAPVIVRNPDSVRPWQHVLAPLSGYLWLGALLLDEGAAYAGPWNFGPAASETGRPVRWVVDRFIDEWGEGSWVSPAPGTSGLAAQHEATLLNLDSSKARTELGWAPVWDAERAIRETAAWYHEYYRAPAFARRLVDDQLLAYERDAAGARLPWARDDTKEAGT